VSQSVAPMRVAAFLFAALLATCATATPATAVYTCNLEGFAIIVFDTGRCNGAHCGTVVAVAAADSCNNPAPPSGGGPSPSQ
jgi:hypothetical protein